MNAPQHWIRTTLSTVGGLLLVSALVGATNEVRAAWRAKADTTQVNTFAREQSAALEAVADSVHAIHVQVDSANLRIRQIRCGPTIDQGCR